MSPAAPARVSTVAALRRQIASWRSRRNEIVFVPTMGALHDGHESLIKRAAGIGRRAVVSIFVNPTQFGPGEDYGAYPRTLAQDLERARKAGADLLFTPAVKTIYPEGFATRVHVSGLDRNLCAPHRPGHFDGVTTVVLKLLNMVEPDRLILGQKDAQQAAIVRRMITDLDLPVRLDVAPTVRERDGLALSSRNRYLSPEERKAAPKIYQALKRAAARIKGGEPEPGKLIGEMRESFLSEPLFRPQYVEIVDVESLDSVTRIERRVLVAVAVFVGRARLIDNVIAAPRRKESV